ncbi:MAG TPA: LysM peptidoglycan-binding domain-containing protein [Fulvivirga sp.]|nr:LysM peptidoglycan-binding domain-containing protein [Fulvivirga sp.]
MIRATALFCLLTVYTIASAQSIKVPSRMEFAGIKLRIMDDAREEIQEDVDALTASPKYYEIKAERARTYFPIIERIFREEGLPDDFKYLCLQESALISDAVSSSNAVGFWQFKDFSAMEVGMRVDKHVDERMNIVSSTRGAARYLQNNNQHFDNWLHALQAYQMGAGGAMKVLKSGDEGAKSMTINKKTYWYVKKYLAHKIAFEGSVNQKGMLEVSEYYDGADKTLKQIANETNVSEEELTRFNKWLKRGKVPTDKPYAVIIPKPGLGTPVAVEEEIAAVKPQNKVEYTFDEPGTFPKIEDEIDARAGKIVNINGLPGIVAGRGVRIPELAVKADISLSKILKYNDLGIDGQLIPGQVYYLKRKRNKARTHYHVVEPGESLWSISQKFGIKLKKLKVKNRIKEDIELKPGRVLWLRYIRPSNVEIEYKEVPTPVKPIIAEPIEVTPTVIPQVEVTDTAMAVVDTLKVVVESDSLSTEISMDSSAVAEEINEQLPEQISESEGVPLIDTVNTDSVSLTHVVKLGETYYAISKIYNVSVLDILEWNNLKIEDKLSVGQKLIIITHSKPLILDENRSVDDTTTYHIVKEGETLYQIARLYGVSVQDIMGWNDKEDFSISYGEKLKIVKSKEEN